MLLATTHALALAWAVIGQVPADGPFPAHRVIANIYYVGSKDLASYLVTTPEGHILINSGFERTVPLIRRSVESLGFRMRDIKVLLASHAHSDHVASHAMMKDMTGAQVHVMRGDDKVISSGGEGQYLDTDSRWKPCQTIEISIRWQTEACTELEVPRPRRSYEVRRTDPAVVERVRALAPGHTDRRIAALLDQEGHRPGMGGPFTADKVHWIRYAHEIPSGCPEGPAACPEGYRGDGRCTAQVAAAELNVNVSTIAAWCRSGRLDGIQAVPHGPRWILITPEIIAELRQPVQRRWSRRPGT